MNPPIPATVNWQSMPKALLHEHLDGGLRAQTLLDLCATRGIPVPADNAAALAQWMQSNANSGSLVRYLQGFALTVEAMASAEACRRVAFEAAEDALQDGCVLAEFRMAPLLLEPFGITPEAVIEALLSGLKESRLASGLILCAMRTDTPEASLRTARLAARYRDQGVVGFDLAGAEINYPPGAHQKAYHVARDAGLGLTCHAGEADLGHRVLEAAAIGARRIGHGVQIMMPPDANTGTAWIARAQALNLHFEACPSSNVHTGTVPSLAEHPIRRMLAAGLSVSCSTDNRLMSGVTLSEEFAHLERHLGLSVAEATRLTRHAIKASFLGESQRNHALDTLDKWAAVHAA